MARLATLEDPILRRGDTTSMTTDVQRQDLQNGDNHRLPDDTVLHMVKL